MNPKNAHKASVRFFTHPSKFKPDSEIKGKGRNYEKRFFLFFNEYISWKFCPFTEFFFNPD
jgi:hypothetical protein